MMENKEGMITGRELVKACIASILDHPSIYMGGPSHHNKRRADRILELLEGWGYGFEKFDYEPNGQIRAIALPDPPKETEG